METCFNELTITGPGATLERAYGLFRDALDDFSDMWVETVCDMAAEEGEPYPDDVNYNPRLNDVYLTGPYDALTLTVIFEMDGSYDMSFIQVFPRVFHDCTVEYRTSPPRAKQELLRWVKRRPTRHVVAEDYVFTDDGEWDTAVLWSDGWWDFDGERTSQVKAFTRFTESGDEEVRLFAAENPDTPAALLLRLAADESEDVAEAVFNNDSFNVADMERAVRKKHKVPAAVDLSLFPASTLRHYLRTTEAPMLPHSNMEN